MDVRHAIRTNGTVREFLADPVPDAVVGEILDDARFAPSGGNRQPWRVAVIRDAGLRAELAALMQPVWDEYTAATAEGQVPFNSVDYRQPAEIMHAANPLLDRIDSIPVVLAVAADLRKIVAMDGELERTAIVPGASIYPFCWNLMLSARAHGLGGVMTTFLSRVEHDAAARLGLPSDHALAATIFLGHPVRQPTRLRRSGVSAFATVDRFDGDSFASDSS